MRGVIAIGAMISLLTLLAAPALAGSIKVITVASDCRKLPELSSASITSMKRGEVVGLIRTQEEWAEIEPYRVDQCWLPKSALSDLDASTQHLAAQTYPKAPTERSSSAGIRQTYPWMGRSQPRSKKSYRSTASGNCPCDGHSVCIGPRGGRYCITSSGNKRYGLGR